MADGRARSSPDASVPAREPLASPVVPMTNLPNNLALIEMPGANKSTLGVLRAKRTARSFPSAVAQRMGQGQDEKLLLALT